MNKRDIIKFGIVMILLVVSIFLIANILAETSEEERAKLTLKEKEKNGFQNPVNEPKDSPQELKYNNTNELFKSFGFYSHYVQRWDGRIRSMRLVLNQLTPQESCGFKPSDEEVLIPLPPHNLLLKNSSQDEFFCLE